MESIQNKRRIHEIETNICLSRNALIVLLMASLIGVITGLSGWIYNPSLLELPVSYHMIITAASLFLLLITFTANIYFRNMKLIMRKFH